MGASGFRRWGVTLALGLALAGCNAPETTRSTFKFPQNPADLFPREPDAPARVAGIAQAQAATLTGKVKLVADAGGSLIANNGGGIISSNGGGIISDAGGRVIANNGSGIISSNAGGIISSNGGSYRLAQARELVIFGLANAVIQIEDGRGQVVNDPQGRPITTTTDGTGSYTLNAVLPPGNLVARVKLFNGGELLAMIVRDGTGAITLDVDVASTLGATYVLGQFVKGDQGVYDRLPRTEAERLRQELGAVTRYLNDVPTYQAESLIAATEALRTREPAIDKAIDDVKALLLGQARLGEGRPATEVPLAQPRGMVYDANGTLYFGESFLGRIRAMAPDGTLTTIADASAGRFKRNFFKLRDMALAPDGSFYVASTATDQVYRLAPSGEVTIVAGRGNGEDERGALLPPLEMGLRLSALAVGADGTLYIGESRSDGAPRLLALAPDGAWSEITLDAALRPGALRGVAVAPDGSLEVLYQESEKTRLVRFRVVGGVASVLGELDLGETVEEFARAADGTIYMAMGRTGRILAFAPGADTPRAVAGAGAPVGEELRAPRSLALAADGTLLVGDDATGLIHALGPTGSWRVVAGSEAVVQAGDTTAFAINQPMGVAFDAAGALYMTEAGSNSVRKFAGGKLELVAGGVEGFAGDGGPARGGRFKFPTGLTANAEGLWVADQNNQRVRRIDPAGSITTALGANGVGNPMAVGDFADVTSAISSPSGLAFDPSGRLYFSSFKRQQLLRRVSGPAGDRIEVVAGKAQGTDFGSGDFLNLGGAEATPTGTLGMPVGMAFNKAGDLFLAEMTGHRVTRVSGLDGALKMERMAGVPLVEMLRRAAAFEGGPPPIPENGLPAIDSTVFFPTGVAFDAADNLYVTEAGAIHMASLGELFGISFPETGSLPRFPGRVRKMTPDGLISTIAGPGGRFFPDLEGDNALIMPFGVAVAPDGRLAIADLGANKIRILPAGSY